MSKMSRASKTIISLSALFAASAYFHLPDPDPAEVEDFAENHPARTNAEYKGSSFVGCLPWFDLYSSKVDVTLDGERREMVVCRGWDKKIHHGYVVAR